jgi:hypothetical protein
VSGGEGELLTVPKPRAVSLLSVYLAVKPVGEPDAGDRHVRFDERGWETGRWPEGPKLPRPSSTLPLPRQLGHPAMPR